MLRVIYRATEPALPLGCVILQTSSFLVWDMVANAWGPPPVALLGLAHVTLSPLAPSGPLMELYVGEIDAAALKWPNGSYVGLVFNTGDGLLEGITELADIRNGDDAPVFPPTTFTITGQ